MPTAPADKVWAEPRAIPISQSSGYRRVALSAVRLPSCVLALRGVRGLFKEVSEADRIEALDSVAE